MPIEEAFDAVKGFVQHSNVCQVHQPHMTSASVWTETASVHQQDVLLVEQIQHELLVVFGPNVVGQADEHVERSPGCLNLKTVNGGDAIEAPLPLCLNPLEVGAQPSAVSRQSRQIAVLGRR